MEEDIITACDNNRINVKLYGNVSVRDRTISKLQEALESNSSYVSSVTNIAFNEEDLRALAIEYASIATYLNANVFSIALMLFKYYKDETIDNFQKISNEIFDEVTFISQKSKIPYYQEALLRYLRLLILQEE